MIKKINEFVIDTKHKFLRFLNLIFYELLSMALFLNFKTYSFLTRLRY